MFKKVLVALDLLDFNDVVFERALALAVAMDAELMLVHALVGDREGGPTLPTAMSWNYPVAMGGAVDGLSDRVWATYQNEWQMYAQRERALLNQYAQQAIAAGVDAEITQSVQLPGRLICEVAHSWGADTVVVGSHGRRGLSELLVGSVSNYVTHHVRADGPPVAVVVVRLANATPVTGERGLHTVAVTEHAAEHVAK
ncbi:MAG: universal stress protein [Cyanobacteria bacterium J06598_3]